MKSFSRILSSDSGEQLQAWTPSALDARPITSPQDVHKEQILALFQNGGDDNTQQKGRRPQSALWHQGKDLVVAAWQLGDVDLRPPKMDTRQWDPAKLSNDLPSQPEIETWEDGYDPDQEAATILKQARVQAEQIILEAQATADKVVAQAKDEIESQKKEGHQQGLNTAQNEMREALEATRALVNKVHEWQNNLTVQGEQILMEMLKEIAQTMFGEGVNLDANALQINLNRVMENAQGLGDLNIFLNPRDAKLLDSSWSEYQFLISGNKIRIIPSEKITPGGCLVKGNTGMVDARVETQLTSVLHTFEEVREEKQ